MPRSTWQFLTAALAVGLAVDILFWNVNPGISFLAWVVVVLAGLFLLGWSEKSKPSPWSIVLSVLALALAGMTFLRLEPFTRLLNGLLALSSLALLASTYRSGNWTHFRLVDYLTSVTKLMLGILVRPLRLIASRPGDNAGSDESSGRKPFSRKTLLPIARGLLLALPVVAVMALLLSSADPIFGDQLRLLFTIDHLPEYIFRLFYILVFALIAGGAFLHAILPDKLESRPDPNQAWFKPFLGWIEAVVVLSCVDLLFALFVGVQFRYFFGGQANISAAGYTYSEYARRGFAELIAVAVLSLILYQTLCLITRREKTKQQRVFGIMSILLLGLVIVMLVSAFQRLLLYEEAYGFTLLRTLPHIFMIWLGVLLLAAVVMEIFRQNGRFALALMLCAVGFGLSLGLQNVDGFIAGQNIERARQGQELDAAYLAGLSSDAIPVMVVEFRRGSLPAKAQDGLGAGLACRAAMIQDNWDPAWQAVHPAREAARQILAGLQAELQAYPVRKDGSSWKVRVFDREQLCRIWAGSAY